MKKSLIALFGIVFTVMANEPIIDELNTLSILKESQIHILKAIDKGDVYLIRGEPTQVPEGQSKKPFNFFITKDKKILITGNAIYTDTKDSVRFPMDKSIIAGKEAFSYGSGKEILYLFVDPQCPYCKEFEKTMPSLKEKYTFKIYLFPLSFHEDAIPMSKWVLKGKNHNDMAERLIAIANGSTEYQSMVLNTKEDQELTNIINAQIEIAQKADIQGTPTVLDNDMNKVNWPSL